MALSTPQVRDLAKKGALARVQEIKAELSQIYQSFPELRRGTGVSESSNGAAVHKPARRKSRISAAGRERIRQAQLKRWAAVRAKRR